MNSGNSVFPSAPTVPCFRLSLYQAVVPNYNHNNFSSQQEERRFAMAASLIKTLLQKAWREQWSVENWATEIGRELACLTGKSRKDFLSVLTESIIEYSLSGIKSDCTYKRYLKDGLTIEQLNSSDILECICKMDKSQNLKQCQNILEIVEDALMHLRKTKDENESLNLVVCLAKTLCWLLGTIASLLKNSFLMAKKDLQNPDVQVSLNICDKCFDLVRQIMDNAALQGLALIGKIEIQAEQEVILQSKLNEIVSLQFDSIPDQNIAQQFQNNLKGLMNDATRFLNSTFHGVMLQNRKPGHVPSYTLQTLVEIQVIENLYMDSSTMSDLLDSVMRSENIPMDQFYVDLMRCGCHGILNAASGQEELLWASFVFFKIPSIVSCLRLKYKQSGLDSSVFFTACRQFAGMNILLDDLDVYCRFQCLPSFLTQCQQKGLLDGGKLDQIMSHRSQITALFDATAPSDRNPVGSVLNAAHLVTDILKVLSLPWEENKDVIRQQLTQLSNSNDLCKTLATAAGMDQLGAFLDQLTSLNENTKGPVSEPNEDPTFAEVRADIFNFSFLLLSYITALFGTKVLSKISRKDSFFVTWRMNCSQDVGQKRYSPMALDMILEQVMAISAPNINAVLAKWDDYCLCSGAVIKELTQALASGVILVDKIQKVCETFKNKRPALSICASSWLCTQYTSMIASKRDMTLKILRAFRGRGGQKPARSEYMAVIIEDLAGSIGFEQQAVAKGKTTGKTEGNQRSAADAPTMNQILQKMIRFPGSPCVDKKSLNELRKHLDVLSPSGFCKELVKAILDSGKIDEAKAFEILSSTLILLDPCKLVPALLGDTMPSILKRSDAYKLLADPQGSTLARFLSKSVAFALILSKAKESNELQRPAKMAKLDITIDLEMKTGDLAINNLVSLIEDLLSAMRWEQIGSVSIFLRSLLEQLCIVTMHLTPTLKLPKDLGFKILKTLPEQPPKEILMLLCNTEDMDGRKQLAHSLCKSIDINVNG
eukprot:Seg153.12_Seg153.6 transcript_id=Seg153.12_Seg153.6/GoldUCD/mRNA.D3Y31 product="Mediator of RNA polymerase II transcription subunit 24" protein_id=Seg153.12_Seg153.6/GoldUCD/D3Y31